MKNDDTKKKLLELIELGAPISKACKKVGVHRSTYYEWMRDDEFGMAVAQARFCSLMETNDAAEYWMRAWVRQGDKKSVYKWVDAHDPMFMRNAIQMTFRGDGPTADEDGVPIGMTKGELFMLLRADETSGARRFSFKKFSKRLLKEYDDWKYENSSDQPNPR